MEPVRQGRFVLSHPDINTIFVREAGQAIREAGWHCRAVTGYVDRPEVWWRRLLSAAGRMAGTDLDREFRRRLLKTSPWNAIDTFPLWELLRIAAIRGGADARFVDRLFHRGIHSLERRTNGVLDRSTVPSPEYDFVEQLLAAEMRAFPELRRRVEPYFERVKAERAERRRREWDLADLVVVNSTFTLKTFEQAGIDVGKVVVIPYGAPDAVPALQGSSTAGRPFRFLWAGTFSIRKGAHHLLEAWRMMRGTDAELDIYGAWGLPDRLRADLPSSIHFRGSIPQSELFDRYAEADILAFPTLCDGFGMVVTEAFARGLPVITTDRAGAADIVNHGENGLIVAGGDVAQLAATLDWCAAHRDEVAAMRPKALETARKRPWSSYRAELASAVARAFELPRNAC